MIIIVRMKKIREIIDYINQHYAENLTIDKLSLLMGYSKTHFMTIFKQQLVPLVSNLSFKQDLMLLAKSSVIVLNQFWKLLLMLVLTIYPISTANLNTTTIKHHVSIEKHIATTRKQKRVSQMVNSFLSANFLVFLFTFVFSTKSKES